MTITAKVKNHIIELPTELLIKEGQLVQIIIPKKKEVKKNVPIWDESNWLSDDELSVNSAKEAEATHRNIPRKAGSSEGLVTLSDDFDEPLEEFKDYM